MTQLQVTENSRSPRAPVTRPSGEMSPSLLQKMLSSPCSHTTLKRSMTLHLHQPDASENLKPRQFDLCARIFPRTRFIFSAAVYSFAVFDLSRLSKGCREVTSSLPWGANCHPLVWLQKTRLSPCLAPWSKRPRRESSATVSQ